MQHQFGPWLYAISTMHCMPVSLAMDGDGLGTMWGEQLAVEMLETVGFADIAVEKLNHDLINAYFVATKS